MNSGPEIISNSFQTQYIGIVTQVAKSELGEITDKVGNVLKPFEILFNVGDILSNAKATPLSLSSEIKPGDSVMIFSMESIYNSTFFYYPIRNLNSPKDSIKLIYNNAVIEFKPTIQDEADLLLSAGNNLIAVNSGAGTVTVDTLDGIKLNSGGGLIDLKNDEQDFRSLLEKLFKELINLKITIPDGQGFVSPDSANNLLSLSSDFEDLFGNVTPTEHYPVVPDNTYLTDYTDEVVSDTGIDILTDEGKYVKGEDPVIDDLRVHYVSDEQYPPAASEEGIESTSPIENVTPLPVECQFGELKNSLQLSPHYTLAHLTVKAQFPHTLRAQVGLSANEIVCNLKALAVNILEPLRSQYPNLRINSGFRAKPSIVGGVSQHQKGEAVDIQIPGMPPSQYMQVAEWIKANLPFDQLIFEHGNSIWIHISYRRSGPLRKSLLTMFRGNYTPGLRLHY